MESPKVNFQLNRFGNEQLLEGDDWYEKMCKFTLSEASWGAYDNGVVSSSGIGDGAYDLYVMKDGDEIVGMKVDFLPDDEDEDDGDCCGVCGGELESDGSCEYCEKED